MELVEVERYFQLADRTVLSPLICGLLNSEQGGWIYLGVKRSGLIRGMVLERKKRDLVSQARIISLSLRFTLISGPPVIG